MYNIYTHILYTFMIFYHINNVNMLTEFSIILYDNNVFALET